MMYNEYTLTSKQIEKLSSFYGYGNSNPDVVFIGIEESLDCSRFEENIKVRESFSGFEDLREAHDKIVKGNGLKLNPLDNKSCDITQWINCAQLLLTLSGKSCDDENLNEFIQSTLGRLCCTKATPLLVSLSLGAVASRG